MPFCTASNLFNVLSIISLRSVLISTAASFSFKVLTRSTICTSPLEILFAAFKAPTAWKYLSGHQNLSIEVYLVGNEHRMQGSAFPGEKDSILVVVSRI